MSTLGGSPNILLIIADDLGQDVVRTGRFFPNLQRAISPIDPDPKLLPRQMKVVTDDGTVQITGDLPNLSLLLRNGVYFQQAWAQPACSPTRASIYTGLHPWKSGVGNPGVKNEPPPELDPTVSYTTLPELLPGAYVAGLFGKWHLGKRAGTYPTDHGWDKHFGTLHGWFQDPETYTNWYPVDSDNDYNIPNDPNDPTADHATWRTVKEAAAWINAQDPVTPWFATIAFHAPHEPFHVPPFSLGFDPETAGDPGSFDYKFNVMTQNMDHHIGRLLGAVSGGVAGVFDFDPIPGPQLRNTVIFFMGDNGSQEDIATQEPKTEIYEYSVLIPLIVADGPAVLNAIKGEAIVPRFLHVSRLDTENAATVHAVDLYLTIARLADPSCLAPSNTDSKDLRTLFTTMLLTVPRRVDPVDPGEGETDQLLRPIRTYNFSQWYTLTEKRATLRNSRYKLNYDAAKSPDEYALYRYEDGKIPGREDLNNAEAAVNIYAEATSGADQEALANLNALLDELINHYRPNEAESFPDPRPF